MKILHNIHGQGNEETHQKKNSGSPGKDSNTGSPECEARTLITQPQQVVTSALHTHECVRTLRLALAGLMAFEDLGHIYCQGKEQW